MTDETNELDARDLELLAWLEDCRRRLDDIERIIHVGRDRLPELTIDDVIESFQRQADRTRGWSNWETERGWSWWTSDARNAEHAFYLVQDGTLEEAAQRLRQWAVDFAPKISASFYLEILQRGLERIDYLELADALRSSLSRAFGPESADK